MTHLSWKTIVIIAMCIHVRRNASKTRTAWQRFFGTQSSPRQTQVRPAHGGKKKKSFRLFADAKPSHVCVSGQLSARCSISFCSLLFSLSHSLWVSGLLCQFFLA